jgi:hypothetical protein
MADRSVPRIRFHRLLLSGLMVSLAGCGGSDVELAPVHGRVTLDGQPVRGVFIIFQPQSGKPSYDMLNADGEFELQYNVSHAGSLIGTHEVFLRPLGPDEQGELAELLPDGVTEATKVPERYRQPFETVEVSDEKQEFTFELTSKGA